MGKTVRTPYCVGTPAEQIRAFCKATEEVIGEQINEFRRITGLYVSQVLVEYKMSEKKGIKCAEVRIIHEKV